MAYTKHTWVEYTGTGVQKAGWLNNAETQYDEMVTYLGTTITHSDRYYAKATSDSKYFTTSNDGSGSGFITEKLDGYTGVELIAQMVPSGVIAIWSGAQVDIPTGWVLCDGSGVTVDLRGKFPVAAGTTYTQGATGGSATVNSTGTVTITTHQLTTSEMPSHTHTFVDQTENATANYRGGAAGYLSAAITSSNRPSGSTGGNTAHGHSGSTLGSGTTDNNMPAYKAYCYIQKT
jgi:microcystin-dependent protein